MWCILFAYGPADATAIPKPHHLLPQLNQDWHCVFCLNRTVYIIKLAAVYIGSHSDMNVDKKFITMCVMCDECLH